MTAPKTGPARDAKGGLISAALSGLRSSCCPAALGDLAALITQQADPSALWPDQLAALFENRDGTVERRCGHIEIRCNRHQRYLCR